MEIVLCWHKQGGRFFEACWPLALGHTGLTPPLVGEPLFWPAVRCSPPERKKQLVASCLLGTEARPPALWGSLYFGRAVLALRGSMFLLLCGVWGLLNQDLSVPLQ